MLMIRAADPSDWEAVRDIRLRSLREEPDAYASDYQTEARPRAPDAYAFARSVPGRVISAGKPKTHTS